MKQLVKALVHKSCRESGDFTSFIKLLHVCSVCVSVRKPSSLALCSRFKDTIINAKYGGHTEAVRRLLGQLPISAQSYSGSPYLDLSLFSYDDKWVSVMERPKTCGDHPIRYFVMTTAPNCFKRRAPCLLCHLL